QERENYEYVVCDGKIINNQSGDFLHTKKDSEDAKWIFVMSTEKKLYAGKKKKGLFHHSSFLAGGATLAAGRLEAEDGVLKNFNGANQNDNLEQGSLPRNNLYKLVRSRVFSFLMRDWRSLLHSKKGKYIGIS
ncbi:hypothetical protein RYX36_007379, partial [Vicia faba]